MINENGILAHPHPLFSFLGGMATKHDCLTMQQLSLLDWGLPVLTDTFKVRKE